MGTTSDTAATVTAAEAIELVKSDNWLLDVREQDEWDRGHAPDAHLIPLSVIGMRLSEVPVDQRIIVICHSGARSERVTTALLDAGYNASNVNGGMMAWQAAGGDVVVAPDAASASPEHA